MRRSVMMWFFLSTARIQRVSTFSSFLRRASLTRTNNNTNPKPCTKVSISRRHRPSKLPGAFLAGLMVVTSTTKVAFCQEDDDSVHTPPFEESMLSYDHYNGVNLHLDKLDGGDANFPEKLGRALDFWKAEGRKGIWIHCSTSQAHLIPHCTDLGFEFHFVKDKTLVLSRWLPQNVPSKLPFGPTHQVGVGTLVFHPSDPSKMLVVQEITGPAAAYRLWKMPTGLLDPGEDIPEAAVRELKEETNLDGVMEGIVCFRQAHSPSRTSDLFFVCRMSLKDPLAEWKAQEDEIADIRWMPVEDYCDQDRWQGSPVYQSLNDSIRKASLVAQKEAGRSLNGMIIHEQLPLGFGRGTNALFRSQL